MKPSFLCSECGRSFMTKRSLENHTLLHGEPTIQCPDCPAKFHQQLTFDIHYQWHKNLTFKCNECEYTCTKLRTLRAHISELFSFHFSIDNYNYKILNVIDFSFNFRLYTCKKA